MVFLCTYKRYLIVNKKLSEVGLVSVFGRHIVYIPGPPSPSPLPSTKRCATFTITDNDCGRSASCTFFVICFISFSWQLNAGCAAVTVLSCFFAVDYQFSKLWQIDNHVFVRAVCNSIEEWDCKGSNFHWIKNQIEPFCIHPSNLFLSFSKHYQIYYGRCFSLFLRYQNSNHPFICKFNFDMMHVKR